LDISTDARRERRKKKGSAEFREGGKKGSFLLADTNLRMISLLLKPVV